MSNRRDRFRKCENEVSLNEMGNFSYNYRFHEMVTTYTLNVIGVRLQYVKVKRNNIFS